jgi:outer membrane protein OmpA-like peptidoglycan-associated protein
LLAPAAFAQDARFPSSAITFPTKPIEAPESRALSPARMMVAPAEETATEVRYRLEADVLFDFDRAEIRPEAEAALRQLVEQIEERFTRPRIRVEGHTDSKGSDAYNQALSERRAEAVKRWMSRSGGLPSFSIETAGFGEASPVASNTHADGSDNPEGRQQNRRVEIVVEKRPQ